MICKPIFGTAATYRKFLLCACVGKLIIANRLSGID